MSHLELSSFSDGLASERELLGRKGLSAKVINTILSNWKPTTNAIYEKIWKKFSFWHRFNRISGAMIPEVLDFLQAGADLNLAVSSFKVQVSALSSFLSRRLIEEPLIKRFLTAIGRRRTPRTSRFPSWDLSLVLQSFCGVPFEPLRSYR